MSKQVITVLVIVALAVVGFFVYRGMSDKTSSEGLDGTSLANSPDADKPDADLSGKKMAFASFIEQGGSYECTVHQSVGGTDSTGKVYVSDGKVRGEFNTQVQGMSVGSTFIVRDGYSYSWSSVAPTMGYKVAVQASGSGDTSAGASGSYSFNAEQIGDYDCQPWTVDSSKFAIPTSVKFTVLNQ